MMLMFGEKCFCTICTQLDIECGNCIIFTIDKMCWADKGKYCMCELLFHSRVAPVTIIVENGSGLLVDCLSDSMINVNYFFVILSGNLNSSTSNISQHITTDTIFHSLCKSSPTNINRCSE